jgi:hypothetical protein
MQLCRTCLAILPQLLTADVSWSRVATIARRRWWAVLVDADDPRGDLYRPGAGPLHHPDRGALRRHDAGRRTPPAKRCRRPAAPAAAHPRSRDPAAPRLRGRPTTATIRLAHFFAGPDGRCCRSSATDIPRGEATAGDQAGTGSMIERRRWSSAMPAAGSTKVPESSAPRWAIVRIIAQPRCERSPRRRRTPRWRRTQPPPAPLRFSHPGHSGPTHPIACLFGTLASRFSPLVLLP